MLQLVCKDIDENNTTYTLGVLTYRMLFFFFSFFRFTGCMYGHLRLEVQNKLNTLTLMLTNCFLFCCCSGPYWCGMALCFDLKKQPQGWWKQRDWTQMFSNVVNQETKTTSWKTPKCSVEGNYSVRDDSVCCPQSHLIHGFYRNTDLCSSKIRHKIFIMVVKEIFRSHI